MDNKNIFEQLTRIAAYARRGDCGNAASETNLCIQALQHALLRAKPSQKELAKLMYSLETMLQMQKQEDWVAFADVIEYEFMSLLEKTLPR